MGHRREVGELMALIVVKSVLDELDRDIETSIDTEDLTDEQYAEYRRLSADFHPSACAYLRKLFNI